MQGHCALRLFFKQIVLYCVLYYIVSYRIALFSTGRNWSYEVTCYYVVLPSWIKVYNTSHQIIDSLSLKGSTTTSEQLVREQICWQSLERIQLVIEHFIVLDFVFPPPKLGMSVRKPSLLASPPDRCIDCSGSAAFPFPPRNWMWLRWRRSSGGVWAI